MSSHLLRVCVRASKIPQRTITASPICSRNVVLDQKLKDEIYPKIGNREVVGYGVNGMASYIDRCEFPCPAIRFKEETADIAKLRQQEKGDWKKLTLEDKKALYRASFCQTFSEIEAPTGEWKIIFGSVLLGLAVTGWIMFFVKKFVYPKQASTLTPEHAEKVLQLMIDQHQGIVTGIASKWDYDKMEWKK
ncbi:cytochrome c oxidase subunit 4 isoform 2, mitochondrial-like [Physella acuta]|uniref:cytochrome c oxidase subunit 4 isoform 2, mitochondrial-like n=1 Tax=Physella acuta TaxID=109671 RepID=UPI0027DB0673|nr:cytochrome c oxidase subunit 4 isoform 2, mitochondrial-like [Physella acuta]XP_059160731.1 cytochrome c oxidase subunit 4 isoform 2, mitochondrial-like [Physella acuta]